MVKGSAESLGLKSVFNDFGIAVNIQISSDATAAIGMVQREGLGKVRHLAVADLWIQHKRRSGEIVFNKVNGKENPSDVLTKSVDRDTMSKHLRYLGFKSLSGRHRLAPQLDSC